MNSVNEVYVRNGERGSKITVRTFTTEAEEYPEKSVLLESDSDALRFLAELILAHVESDVDCYTHLHPKGAGSGHFTETSNLGIYLHKLPCQSGEV